MRRLLRMGTMVRVACRASWVMTLCALGGAGVSSLPASPFDPAEPGVQKRVQRGGSFLCTDQYCSRYMVGTRGKGDISTGTNHVGFRTVVSPVPRSAER
jgi:formylglycine-generating enzyme required for sulfatase activity